MENTTDIERLKHTIGSYARLVELQSGKIDQLKAENQALKEHTQRLSRQYDDAVAEVAKCQWKMSEQIKRLVAENQTLMEEVKTERAERIKWQRIRKSTHGTCCTCQRCGLDHDSCRCDLDEVVDEIEQLKAESQALKEELEAKNTYLRDYMEILHEEQERGRNLQAESQALKEEVERLEGIEKERIQWRQENTLFRDRMNTAEAANQALKATVDNIYDNIKGLPAGHERFALDCIRKLLKPMEQERMGHGKDVQ